MGFAPLAPVAAARARAAVERFDETDWDEELDVLVTHTPMSTILRIVGSIGLAALLFMYITAWQRPLLMMAEEAGSWIAQQIERRQTAETMVSPAPPRSAPVPSSGGETGDNSTATTPGGMKTAEKAPEPVDSEAAASLRKLEEFREAIVRIREDSLLLLDKKDWKRAHESCQRWAKLEITNPAPMRCQGVALQAMGRHQEAINAFRSAKIYAPEDRSLDDAITRSQDEIFKALNR